MAREFPYSGEAGLLTNGEPLYRVNRLTLTFRKAVVWIAHVQLRTAADGYTWGEMTSQNLWSLYVRHFDAMCGVHE